jgi:crossover junction endodeoxyribonuclease RusA
MVIYVSVIGLEPAPQGSKRHVGGGRMIESSKRVKPWRAAVAHEAANAGHQITTACSVELEFRFKRPQGHWKVNGELRDTAPRHCIVKRNDIDKCCRSTLDGLVDGGLLLDDSLVTDLRATKRYCLRDEEPGVLARVQRID